LIARQTSFTASENILTPSFYYDDTSLLTSSLTNFSQQSPRRDSEDSRPSKVRAGFKIDVIMAKNTTSNDAVASSGGSLVGGSSEETPTFTTSRDDIPELGQLSNPENHATTDSVGSPVEESSSQGPTSTTSPDNTPEPEQLPTQGVDPDYKARGRAGYIISILGIISAALFFGMQYKQSNALAITSNTLAIEESCRSHPVIINLPNKQVRLLNSP
jgi:hypothetical protein